MIRDFIPEYLKKELQELNLEEKKLRVKPKSETFTLYFFKEWAESLFFKGKTIKEISSILEIDRVTISRWLQKKGHLKRYEHIRKSKS